MLEYVEMPHEFQKRKGECIPNSTQSTHSRCRQWFGIQVHLGSVLPKSAGEWLKLTPYFPTMAFTHCAWAFSGNWVCSGAFSTLARFGRRFAAVPESQSTRPIKTYHYLIHALHVDLHLIKSRTSPVHAALIETY